MKIGLDIDDVIAKTGQVFYQKMNERFGLDVEFTKVPSYDFIHKEVLKKGFTKDELYKFLVDMQLDSAYHDSLLLRRDGKETIKKLYKQGHIIYLISNRHVLILPYTTVWLKKLGILPYVSGVIHNSYMQKPYDEFKIREAKRLKLDLFFEDALDYALPIAKEKIPVILFDRPWNQTQNLSKNIYRVNDWQQALMVFNKVASKVNKD